MIRKIKERLSRHRFEKKLSNLKRNGAYIGKRTTFFSNDIVIDSTRPFLIHIGDYCKIAKGVIILTHDYSLSVMRRVFGDWIGEGKETYIGDNCFIGMNSVILMGAHIGNNCIVGAGSIVHGSFPDSVVIAGNPARIICTLEEHYMKRKSKTISEAKECALLIKQKLNRIPTPQDLIGFRFLFAPRSEQYLHENNIDSFECSSDEPEEIKRVFFSTQPFWKDFDSFLLDALGDNKQE